jgi:hypothetical protein
MRVASYIKFLFNSINEHGVHSPFVFGLVKNGFYRKQPLIADVIYDSSAGLNTTTLNILFRVIVYFKSYKLIVLGDDAAATAVAETMRQAAEEISTKIWFYSTYVPVPGGVDLAILTGNDTRVLLPLMDQLVVNVNNNSIAVIANIHQSEAIEQAWLEIIKNPNVTVSIDAYHLGFLFFRKEQQKQHFVIRPFRSGVLDAFLGIRTLWGLLLR